MTKRKENPKSVGRPPKVDDTDANAIISRIKEQQMKFNAKCADKLHLLFDVIFSVAVDKKAPLKDKVAAAKYCVESAEKYLKEDHEENPSKGETPSEESSSVKLISLKAVD